MNWIVNIFKDLTFVLDKFIYWLAGMVYQVFQGLANFNIFGKGENTIITNITTRIYVIMGIVMVFILAFNLLNYIIDPDKVKDKSVGASTFIKDIVIALVIMTILQPIFNKLYDFQDAIIRDNTLANLILGGNVVAEAGGEATETDMIDRGADIMIASVYTAFLKPSEDGSFQGKTALDCNEINTSTSYNGDYSFEDYCLAYRDSKSGAGISAFDGFHKNENYDFTPFMTTIAGVVLLVFMFLFCFQLAIRVGKMAIIQLLAPVALTLEILPNKKGTRKKWFETLIKVYLDVFVYMLIIYFIILLISLIPSAVGAFFENANGGIGLVATLILIFGLLMFAKEAPKMLTDILGIKESNLIKDTFTQGGGMAAFLGGTAGSMIGGGIRNAVNTKGNWAQKLGSGIAGAGSTAVRNIWGARNVHSIRDANNLRRQTNQAVANRRMNRDAYAAAHQGRFGAFGGHIADLGQDIGHAARSFVGLTASSTHPELAMLDTLQNKFKNDRVIENNDARYSEQRNLFNEQASKDNNFIKGYNAYRNRTDSNGNYINENASYQDYYDYLKKYQNAKGQQLLQYTNADKNVLQSNSYAQLAATQTNMDSRKASMIRNKVNSQIADLQEMKVILENSPQLKELVDKNGNKLSARIATIIDDKGKLIAPGTEAQQQAAVNQLIEDYNTAINKRRNAINIETATERAREEQRQARHNNNNNNSGGNNK